MKLVRVLQCVCRNEPKNTSKEIAYHKQNYNLQPTYLLKSAGFPFKIRLATG